MPVTLAFLQPILKESVVHKANTLKHLDTCQTSFGKEERVLKRSFWLLKLPDQGAGSNQSVWVSASPRVGMQRPQSCFTLKAAAHSNTSTFRTGLRYALWADVVQARCCMSNAKLQSVALERARKACGCASLQGWVVHSHALRPQQVVGLVDAE
eukprot:1578201-Amphidinium_carterae.1